MGYKRSVLLTRALILVVVNCDHSSVKRSLAAIQGGYERGRGRSCPGCNKIIGRCCVDGAVSDYFQIDQFDKIFSKRNSIMSHAKGFWDYHSFITASTHYQAYGFGTTYINGNFFGTKEVAAFLPHVGSKTSCE